MGAADPILAAVADVRPLDLRVLAAGVRRLGASAEALATALEDAAVFGPDRIVELKLRRFLRQAAGSEMLDAFQNSEAPVWQAVGEAAAAWDRPGRA